jgi:hypothetical protein
MRLSFDKAGAREYILAALASLGRDLDGMLFVHPRGSAVKTSGLYSGRCIMSKGCAKVVGPCSLRERS